jgi:magnesium transporter
VQITSEFIEELQLLLKNGNETDILEKISDLHAVDLAAILDQCSLEEAQQIYKLIDSSKAADVLIELDEDIRERFLSVMTSKEIAEQFIDNLDSDDAADIIAELPENIKDEVLSHIEDAEQASDIVDLLNYPEGTAGSLMAKELIKVQEEWTVAQSIRELRNQAKEIENVYTIYVVDENNKLLGTLSLKSFLFYSPKAKIKEFFMGDVKSVKATAKSEEVSSMMEKYDLIVLPVIDDLGRLIGRITIDDVVDVIIEESEKDYQMASGLSENVDVTDSVWILTRARLPWLLIGLLGGIFGSQVIGIFEGELHIHPEMALFIPLIAAMAGNVGVQSSAIVVQGLANKTFVSIGIFTKLSKEFLVGLMNGIICAAIIFAYNTAFQNPTQLSLTVSISLLTVIVFAAMFGTIIPIILNRFKIDPAVATGPFITTMNDIVGLLLYFYIGRLMYM